eukprot:gene25802-32295_t
MEALQAIYNSQNPVNCSTAKYLISSGGSAYGFGYRMHVEGMMLSVAMELGRVFLPHPDGDGWLFETKNSFCQNGDRWEPGFNCYYEPVSSKCTIKDALPNLTAQSPLLLPMIHHPEKCLSVMVRHGDKEKEMKLLPLAAYTDPDVVDQANKWGREGNWTIGYTTLMDRAVLTFNEAHQYDRNKRFRRLSAAREGQEVSLGGGESRVFKVDTTTVCYFS